MSSFCLFLYLLHIPPRLILLHNSVPYYIIKSSVDDVCLRLKMNTLHIQILSFCGRFSSLFSSLLSILLACFCSRLLLPALSFLSRRRPATVCSDSATPSIAALRL